MNRIQDSIFKCKLTAHPRTLQQKFLQISASVHQFSTNNSIAEWIPKLWVETPARFCHLPMPVWSWDKFAQAHVNHGMTLASFFDVDFTIMNDPASKWLQFKRGKKSFLSVQLLQGMNLLRRVFQNLSSWYTSSLPLCVPCHVFHHEPWTLSWCNLGS